MALFTRSSFGVWAALVDSDTAGINFASVLDHINVDTANDADYERLQSIEGVAIANEVVNWETAGFGDKILQTVITVNDGTGAATRRRPPRDSTWLTGAAASGSVWTGGSWQRLSVPADTVCTTPPVRAAQRTTVALSRLAHRPLRCRASKKTRSATSTCTASRTAATSAPSSRRRALWAWPRASAMWESVCWTTPQATRT